MIKVFYYVFIKYISSVMMVKVAPIPLFENTQEHRSEHCIYSYDCPTTRAYEQQSRAVNN